MLPYCQFVAKLNCVGVRVGSDSVSGQTLPQRHMVPSLRSAMLPLGPAETERQLVSVPI